MERKRSAPLLRPVPHDAGIYLASVTAISTSGATSTSAFLPITLLGLNQPPIARLICNKSGETSISCDASESYDLDGDIADIAWNVATLNLTGSGPGFDFELQQGEFATVRVSVTDNQGARAMKEIQVSVGSGSGGEGGGMGSGGGGPSNISPVAQLTCEESGILNLSCNAVSSSDEDGQIVFTPMRSTAKKVAGENRFPMQV